MGIKRCPSFSKRPGFPCGLKVLLVDADQTARSQAEELLKNCSYSVTTCSTVPEAILCLSSSNSSYDVLLADTFGATNQDRQQLLDSSKHLPCILMAQAPSPTDIMAGIKLGAVDILAKPLSPLKLRNIWQHTVRKMMSNMNIHCATGASLDCEAPAAASGSAPAAAAVKHELAFMDVILEEEEDPASKIAKHTRHGPVHSCPSTRSLNSMDSSYSALHLSIPAAPGSPTMTATGGGTDALTTCTGEEGGAPAGASSALDRTGGSPAAGRQVVQRVLKKALRHCSPSTPASKPPLAASKPGQHRGSSMGPGATAAGPLPTRPLGFTSVPLPTGLGVLPQGMVWGMPMCPLARAPGIVPPAIGSGSVNLQQQHVAGVTPAAAGLPAMPAMPWMAMPPMFGMPPAYMPGFGAMGMPMPPLPFTPFGAAPGMRGTLATPVGPGAAAMGAKLQSAQSCSAGLLGSMSDLFADCSAGDSDGMTRVDSCGMLADLHSLFGSEEVVVRDDGCSTAPADIFDDVVADLPLELAMRKSSSLAELITAGLPPMAVN
eukprot:gene5146-5386_t